MRDPVHNLIEFDDSEFEQALWQVVQSGPFQRLRRIRQLGFSEFVFPGATHTRFAHSLGVFHTARQLMAIVKRQISPAKHGSSFSTTKAQIALAASLVHDVGHGMFSHAFEAVGKELEISMAQHERVSEAIIRDSEITELFKTLGSGFASDVADLIARKEPGNLYDSVVSSQFDADRLDYMQRDRLMTGVQSSAIDLHWLLANLEIGAVPTGADDTKSATIETLVLGPKAAQTAESYVLSLFHLYPNVYLHKTTRGIELAFGALIYRLIFLVREGNADKTGLPPNHPIIRFVENPDGLMNALALDDQVFWGALPMIRESEDKVLAAKAKAFAERQLLACIDIRTAVEGATERAAGESPEKYRAKVKLICTNIVAKLKEQTAGMPISDRSVFLDRYERTPYKRFQDSATPLNQIQIKIPGDKIRDVAELSTIIAGATSYEICRAYTVKGDDKAREMVENEIRTQIRANSHGST